MYVGDLPDPYSVHSDFGSWLQVRDGLRKVEQEVRLAEIDRVVRSRGIFV
jgi:hypothetical protein